MKKLFTLACAATAIKYVIAAIVLVKAADIAMDNIMAKRVNKIFK